MSCLAVGIRFELDERSQIVYQFQARTCITLARNSGKVKGGQGSCAPHKLHWTDEVIA